MMNWKRGSILLLVLLLAAALFAGCGGNSANPQEPPTPPEQNGQTEEPAGEPAPLSSYQDGSYEGVGQGYAGDITIEVTIAGGAITNIEIVDEQETASIGGVAFTDLVESAKEAQSAEIDIVTGATITTEGFQQALRDALSQASE